MSVTERWCVRKEERVMCFAALTRKVTAFSRTLRLHDQEREKERHTGRKQQKEDGKI